MKPGRFTITSLVLLSFTLFFISCSPQSAGSESLILVHEAESDGIHWRIYTENSDYYYTDRIPLTIEARALSGPDPVLRDDSAVQGDVWGDFRIYETKQIGYNRYQVILQPLKSGLSVFRVPESLPFTTEFEIQIRSRLEESESSVDSSGSSLTEPLPLIREKHRSLALYITIVLLSILLISLSLFLVLKSNKRKGKIEVHGEVTLDRLFTDASAESDWNETKCLEFYRRAYRLLLKDLSVQHDAVSVADSPLELMKHLEVPSSMNQWALRSLYPMLEDWERCFFAPSSEFKIEDNLEKNLEILRSWINFQSSETEELKG